MLLNDFVFTNNPKHLYLYTEKRLGSSVAPFLSFSPKQFSVPAKGQKKVKVTFLNNGKKLKAGKYSALIFEVEGQMKKGSSTVAIAARIATTVFGLPNVKNMGGQINFFKTSSSLGLADGIFGLKKEPSFIISFKNTGNTHLNVSGQIDLKNFLGKRIQTIKFPEYEVYPGLTRDITIPWTKKPIGYFNAKAKVFASLGDKNIKDTSKISKFFYIPYWMILAILAGLAAAIFYFRSKRRKRV